jgi:toxin ParE1/3/4
MKPVIFHPQAEEELVAVIDYYDNQRDGLGAEFQAEVEQATQRIAQLPTAGTLHNDAGVRKRLVRRFPYTIFYIEFDESIWIAAVAHQKREPDYWAHRHPEG